MQSNYDSSDFAHRAMPVCLCHGCYWHGVINADGRFAVKVISRPNKIL
jgi:hypothetical protein